MTRPSSAPECSEQDVRRLLETLYEQYDIDLRDYALPTISRRLCEMMRSEGVRGLDEFRVRLLSDPDCMDRLLRVVTVHVTTMFRDPDFYRAFRRHVVPLLRQQSFVRIWHAGCSTGEEVYSLAILLEEEGLRRKSRIYATDVSERVLDRARTGIFPLPAVREFTTNYIQAGGQSAFSDYYTASYGRAILKSRLREHIVFSRHNLVSDRPFHNFDVVLCRNVLIYFNEPLTHRVHQLLYDSLIDGGVLGLGARETVRFTPFEGRYEVMDADARLFRKLG